MAVLDHKRYIDRASNSAFAERMNEWFGQDRVPPFAIVFPETEEGYVTDDDKPGKEFIQFGFIITDREGRVLPHSRAAYDHTTAKAGHTITGGCSLLVSWSPVAAVNGRSYPQSEADVLRVFHREVRQRPGEPPPSLYFLGLARRRVPLQVGGETTYYFYLFESRYSGRGPCGEWLVKDKNDQLFYEFVTVDDTLLSAVQKNKVDLRAVEALTGRDLSSYGYGRSEMVRLVANEVPPFLVRPPGVFLCHSSADKSIVYELADRLEVAGIPTWVDHRRLRPGEVWFEQAFEAIKYCPAFIAVCTAASSSSQHVRDEVDQALQRQQWLATRGVRYEICPVIFQGEKPETFVPPALKDHQGVDLRDPAGRSVGTTEFIGRLREALGLDAGDRVFYDAADVKPD
jgi:hypothetical protein